MSAPLIATRQGVTTVLQITAENVVNTIVVDELGSEIDLLIDQDPEPRFAIDFHNVQHVSSLFLGKLVMFHKKIEAKGGMLVLMNVNPEIAQILSLTGIDKRIRILREGACLEPTSQAWGALVWAVGTSLVLGLLCLGTWMIGLGPRAGQGMLKAGNGCLLITIFLAILAAAVRTRLHAFSPRAQWGIVAAAWGLALGAPALMIWAF